MWQLHISVIVVVGEGGANLFKKPHMLRNCTVYWNFGNICGV